MHTLEVDSVQLEFGFKRVLSDVYVRCDTGTITGLLGRNGAGKSCFMQIAFGTMKAYSRSVRCDGRHVAKPHAVKGFLNYMPQFHFVPQSMSAATALRYYGIPKQNFLSTFPEYEKDIRKTMGELSGGQRRMIETFIILAADTQFTILDEPFSHIMPLHTEHLKTMMHEAKQRKGIIVTDHMYRHILDISDTLYLLNNGKTHRIHDKEQLVQHGYISAWSE